MQVNRTLSVSEVSPSRTFGACFPAVQVLHTWEMCKERLLFHSTSPVQVRLRWYSLVKMFFPFLAKLFSSGMVLRLHILPVKAVPLKEFLASDTLWNRSLYKTLQDVEWVVHYPMLEILLRSFSAGVGKEQLAHRVTLKGMRDEDSNKWQYMLEHAACGWACWRVANGRILLQIALWG